MKKNKAFSPIVIIVAILIVILVIVLVLVLINPANKDKSVDNQEYLGWKSYSSSYGGIVFYYPENWTTTDISATDKALSSRVSSESDKIQLLDSNKKALVYWSTYSTSPDIPGCDVNTKPGNVSNISDPDNRKNFLKGCSEITIIGKHQVPNLSGLYYVEGIMTKDYKTYFPVCGISADSNTDMIKSYSFSPWFPSKKSKNKSTSNTVQLLCQSSSTETVNPGLPEYSGTKDEIVGLFKKEPFLTIKKLMLSIKSV